MTHAASFEELAEEILPDALLETFRERAAVHDRENSFCDDDLADLRARGYLTLLVPEDRGGSGLTVHEVAQLQQRLAGAAPGTALAVNMHLMCTAVAKAMADRGDDSLRFVLDEAAAGEIFAFGVSEPGNDWVLQGSTTTATPRGEGGYDLTGTKIFTSLSPVWTRLIVHGLDTSTPEDPRLIYGFIDRDEPGITVSERWDVLGMRASHSRTTRLDGVRLRADRVVRDLEPGPVPDLLTFAIAACFQILVGSVYAGVARRALEVAAASLHGRRSAKAAAPLSENPELRARVADAHREFLAVPALIEQCARGLDDGADFGAQWPLMLVATRIAAGDAARRCAEVGLMCTGGAGYDNDHEMSRLFRDATASLFHPPGADAARPMYAAALIDIDEETAAE